MRYHMSRLQCFSSNRLGSFPLLNQTQQ
ncbi:hypothetical protein NQ317_002909 [Molorchus minor]|uniref:Uncharacterized protein n=1 Tax=Molorchus minor TaxID=1323400 RepID=A0ABQ9JIF1_9CUCU|nr:hypothetical protein NQ317_002909 [Molorchus minor]